MAEAAKNSGIGQPVRRREDLRLVRGGGRYTADENLPGQVYAVMVRSPHAHARIRSIATDDAKAAPGVLAVLTGADFAACTVSATTIATASPTKRALSVGNG